MTCSTVSACLTSSWSVSKVVANGACSARTRRKVMGWKDENGRALGLEDFYDETKGQGTFREKYEEAVNHPLCPVLRYKQSTS